MHLSQCILLVAYLSTGISAFYPYNLKPPGSGLGSDKLRGRFLPWRLGGEREDMGHKPPTVKLKRIPKLVRSFSDAPSFSRAC
jgi:hypothetical protein